MTIYSLDVLLFQFWNQSVIPCPVLTVTSWPAYRFLKRQVRWSDIPNFRNFPQIIVIHTVQGFGIVSKAEINVFLELSCFFDNPVDAGNLISDSSAFSKTSLNIRKFTVHVLLKPQFSSVAQSCLTLCNPVNRSMPGTPSITNSRSSLRFTSI